MLPMFGIGSLFVQVVRLHTNSPYGPRGLVLSIGTCGCDLFSLALRHSATAIMTRTSTTTTLRCLVMCSRPHNSGFLRLKHRFGFAGTDSARLTGHPDRITR